MEQKFNKNDSYNPPTEYDTSKVYIVRIEQEHKPSVVGLLYTIVFRGKPEDLNNTKLLLDQAQLHLKHENLTGFQPYFPWPPVEDMGNMSERKCIYRQITL